MVNQHVTVIYDQEETVNGLGTMIGQYLEQNIEEFENKRKQALKLDICTTVEMDKGIASTIRFSRDKIFIKNGVAEDSDMHMKGSYLTLANILTGKANPVKEILKKNVQIIKHPLMKPIQTFRLLSFLKIPKELLIK